MNEKMPNTISVPQTHDVRLDIEYGEWLKTLKTRYTNAQSRALVKVNAENLLWKWQLGRELVTRKAEERWGAGVVEQLSFDLQEAFPNDKGFGSRNLWDMKRWYMFYSQKLKQGVAELLTPETEQLIKLQRSVAELTDTPTDGGAVTNFTDMLPLPQAELAQEITKETYDFGFINLPDGRNCKTTAHHRAIARKGQTTGTGI